jgi:hypothetical protein
MKRSMCFDVSVSELRAPVLLYSCHGMQGNQKWVYDVDTLALFHPISGLLGVRWTLRWIPGTNSTYSNFKTFDFVLPFNIHAL